MFSLNLGVELSDFWALGRGCCWTEKGRDKSQESWGDQDGPRWRNLWILLCLHRVSEGGKGVCAIKMVFHNSRAVKSSLRFLGWRWTLVGGWLFRVSWLKEITVWHLWGERISFYKRFLEHKLNMSANKNSISCVKVFLLRMIKESSTHNYLQRWSPTAFGRDHWHIE